MNSDPLILTISNKVISLDKALNKIEKFTALHSQESLSSISNKQQRLINPSDDTLEKLKTMITSIKEEVTTYEIEQNKNISYDSKKRSLVTSETPEKKEKSAKKKK